MTEEENIVRIDKWLWAARLFKTRSLAADAIKGGKVKMVIKNRVSPKQVPEVYTDLTPQEEYERIEFMHAYKAEWRDRGAGRPTKKERRLIERLKDDM